MKRKPYQLAGRSYYFVGIKGTGMTALADLFVQYGAQVSGSDVEDVFYTDTILHNLQIPVFQGFSTRNVPDEVDFVVHSAAYDPATHPELVLAGERRLPIQDYPEALGAFSVLTDSSAVSGVHGKTTTTAMCGTLVKSLGLQGSVLVGSGVSNFDGRSTYVEGNEFFIAETCEYRRHFLRFSPKRIIMTSLEPDHLDYFKDYEDMAAAFVEFGNKLPEGGQFIFCADDPGAFDVANRLRAIRNDLAFIPYGFTAEGDYRISSLSVESERQTFSLEGFVDRKSGQPLRFSLRVPGRHNVLNAAASIALIIAIYTDKVGNLSPQMMTSVIAGLEAFAGCKRRSEVLGEVGGILFMDDYAHHPTAIRTTLEGYRSFFPSRRIVVDFMSHTYSRTQALLSEFAGAFGAADAVILHKIYASAREPKSDQVSGQKLFEMTKAQHPNVHYYEDPMDAKVMLKNFLQPGDLFVTMGAGDNWKLGQFLFETLGRTGSKAKAH